MDGLPEYLAERRRLIDLTLDRRLPSATSEPRAIHECMRYSTAGGKRLRPLITLAVCESLGGPVEKALPTGAAIELIHAHSLILDDLPCMDDDDERRGRPACHRAYGESVALLAADAVLNLAISILGCNHRDAGLPAETALQIIAEVGEAAGTGGVIGGQQADLRFCDAPADWEADGAAATLESERGASGAMAGGARPRTSVGDETREAGLLEAIHRAKTASLFRLAARAGALVAAAGPRELGALGVWGENLGLCFQIVDDLLDAARDAGRGDRRRPSFALVCGEDRARSLAAAAAARAVQALDPLAADTRILRRLVDLGLARTS